MFNIEGRNVTNVTVDGKTVTSISINGTPVWEKFIEPETPIVSYDDRTAAFTIEAPIGLSIYFRFENNDWEFAGISEGSFVLGPRDYGSRHGNFYFRTGFKETYSDIVGPIYGEGIPYPVF